MTISNGTDATSLQQDLDKLAKWEETWQMEFHPQKCSVLHITRSLNPKYKQYTLHGHNKKANTSLGFLGRNLKIGQENIKTTSVYFTLVRPQLEYAAAIWDPYSQTYKNKIEMVQHGMFVTTTTVKQVSAP